MQRWTVSVNKYFRTIFGSDHTTGEAGAGIWRENCRAIAMTLILFSICGRRMSSCRKFDVECAYDAGVPVLWSEVVGKNRSKAGARGNDSLSTPNINGISEHRDMFSQLQRNTRLLKATDGIHTR